MAVMSMAMSGQMQQRQAQANQTSSLSAEKKA